MTQSGKTLRDCYDRDGYVIVRDAVAPERVKEALVHAMALVQRYRQDRPEELHRRPLWFEDPFYIGLAREPRLLDIAEALLGPDLALFAAGYILKPPSEGVAVLWHQDGSYWPLEPMEVCTLWAALTPSTRENGCMRVIPGTHTMALQPLATRTDVPNLLQSEMDPDLVDERRAVDIQLQPGDVSVHHPNIIHGSNANTSADQWRVNLVVRVISSHTRVTNPDWKGVFHLRGARREDLNTYLEIPDGTPESG